VAERAVPGQYRDRVTARRCQSPLGMPGQHLVDLDADHVAGAEPVREQGGVVAGTGADLQHPLARLGTGRGEHLRHDARVAGGAGDVAAVPVRADRVTVINLDGHRPVRVGDLQPPVRLLTAAHRHQVVGAIDGRIVPPHGVGDEGVARHG
jgi:hypothetical protein